MKCPTHDTKMPATRTKYGLRYACDVEGCTVVCWDGKTSRPGDQETRTLRQTCHIHFDPLWRGGSREAKRFKNRKEAYRWLMRFMGTTKYATHIGYFDAEQCRKLLAEIGPKIMNQCKRCGHLFDGRAQLCWFCWSAGWCVTEAGSLFRIDPPHVEEDDCERPEPAHFGYGPKGTGPITGE